VEPAAAMEVVVRVVVLEVARAAVLRVCMSGH
jgi:hypothetical protein